MNPRGGFSSRSRAAAEEPGPEGSAPSAADSKHVKFPFPRSEQSCGRWICLVVFTASCGEGSVRGQLGLRFVMLSKDVQGCLGLVAGCCSQPSAPQVTCSEIHSFVSLTPD